MLKKIFGLSSKKKKGDQETKGTPSDPSSPQKSKDPNTSFGPSSPKRMKNSSTTDCAAFPSPKKEKEPSPSSPPSTTKRSEAPKKMEKQTSAPIAVHRDPLTADAGRRSASGGVTPCSPTILKKSGEYQVAGQVSSNTMSRRHSPKSPLPETSGSTNGATHRPQLSGSPNSLLEGSNGVNVWRLPWQQPRVVTCQYCHRPRDPQRNAFVSKEKKCGADDEDRESFLSSTSSDDSSECAEAGVTYCRCPRSSASVPPEDVPEPVLPVFIVETHRTHSLPGFVALTIDTHGEEEEGEDINDGPTKLSLVSPLTTHALRKSRSGRISTDQSAAGAQRRGSAFDEREEEHKRNNSYSISAWLESQEVPTKSVAATGK